MRAACRPFFVESDMAEERNGAPGAARRRDARGRFAPDDGGDGPSREARMAVQQRAARKGSWTPEVRARFFAALADSCNIKAACRAGGMSVSGAYMLRERDADFRLGWRRGIAQGYAKLELQMLERALIGEKRLRAVLDKSDHDDERALDIVSRFSPRVAETLYRAHRGDAIDHDLGADDLYGDEARALIETKVEKLRAALAAKLERDGR